MAIELRNFEATILVRNNDTNVEVYLNKNTVSVQKNSSKSLMIISGAYTIDLDHTKVSIPSTTNVDDLMDFILLWVTDSRMNTNFGDLRTIERTVIFDLKSTFSISATLGKIQNETSHFRLGFRSEIPNFHPLTFSTFHLSNLSVWRH